MKRSINNAAPGAALLSLFTGFGAAAASSCCALPLALSTAGLGGAWLSGLSELTVYRPYFLSVAAVALAAGWVVAVRWRTACARADTCTKPARTLFTFSLLALSTLMVGTAAAWDWLEPPVMATLLRLTA